MLTNYNGTAISYDAIGNPTNWRNTYSMSWDARRLTNQRMNNSDWLTYTYNSSGIRTQKYFFNDIEMYGTTHDYVLDGTNIIRETVTGGGTTYTLHYLYDETGSVQGLIYNDNYYYYQKNLQGDVIRILNYSGNVVTEYTYDAWGKVLSVTGSQASTIGQYNPFRYRSYYYDVETGFYYLKSRYYDPVVGRFLNADSATMIGANGKLASHNLFTYALNNPTMLTDPNGYDAILLYDNSFPPHMGALIQDADGNWWHFYWGPKGISKGASSAITNFPVESDPQCVLYTGELTLDAINASGIYDEGEGTYGKMVRLEGDFSSAVEDARTIDGYYSLQFYNCIHVTLGLLAKPDTPYSDVLKSAADNIFIGDAFDDVAKFDEGLENTGKALAGGTTTALISAMKKSGAKTHIKNKHMYDTLN